MWGGLGWGRGMVAAEKFTQVMEKNKTAQG